MTNKLVVIISTKNEENFTIWNEISCSKLQLPPEPLTRGLPPPDPRSLCPLSSTEFFEPPRRSKFLGTPLGYCVGLTQCSEVLISCYTSGRKLLYCATMTPKSIKHTPLSACEEITFISSLFSEVKQRWQLPTFRGNLSVPFSRVTTYVFEIQGSPFIYIEYIGKNLVH